MTGPLRSAVLARPVRRRAGWDLALSAVLLVASSVAYWIGFVFAVLGLSLLTPCSAGVCGSAQAGGVQFVAALALFVLGVVGTVLVVALQVVRRRSWWVGATALVLTIGGWFTAFGLSRVALLS